MKSIALLFLIVITCAQPQITEKPKSISRYGIDLDTKSYPQNTPKDALGSVIKAVAEKQIEYLLAQLADPAFVDQRVAATAAKMGPNVGGNEKNALAFRQFVQITMDSFQKDPSKLSDLRRFYQDGEWQEEGDNAVATLKGLPSRKVFMKKIAPDRWALLDREK
jgi:hypothetical protein